MLIACRDKIIDKYQNKSPLALLPLLLADKQSQIDKIKSAKSSQENLVDVDVKAIPCSYTFDEKGELCLIEQKCSDIQGAEVIHNDEFKQLKDAIESDFKCEAPALYKENDAVKGLVVSVFVPHGATDLEVKEEEIENEKKKLQDIYSNSLESFAKAVASVVEKFAGVKSFFDHATCDGKLPKDVSVIISNCKIDAILNDEIAKRRFKKYFGALSAEKDVNKIWFGIIPAIAYGEKLEVISEKISNPFAKRSESNSTNKVEISENSISISVGDKSKIVSENEKILITVDNSIAAISSDIEMRADKIIAEAKKEISATAVNVNINKHYEIGKRICPYLEVFMNDSDYIEVNPMIRFSEISDLDMMKWNNNGDCQNIVFHYLAQLDRVKGLSLLQRVIERLRNEIEKGYWGSKLSILWISLSDNDQEIVLYNLAQRLLHDNNTYFMETVGELFPEVSLCYEEKTKWFYLYIRAEKNEYNKKLLSVVKSLFWNISQNILVIWKSHYGIIGCNDTMRVDNIQII